MKSLLEIISFGLLIFWAVNTTDQISKIKDRLETLEMEVYAERN